MNNPDGFREAVPTEYAGVKFRAKSEAIFARALDLEKLLWEYEPPDFFDPGIWKPDFFICWRSKGHKVAKCLLEFKPCETTEAYRESLHIKINDSLGQLGGKFFFLLVEASPFDVSGKASVYSIANNPHHPIEAPIFKSVVSMFSEARKFRFDLKNGGGRV